jgi:hypothetical protein
MEKVLTMDIYIHILLTNTMRCQGRKQPAKCFGHKQNPQSEIPPLCTVPKSEGKTRISKPKCNKNPPKKF